MLNSATIAALKSNADDTITINALPSAATLKINAISSLPPDAAVITQPNEAWQAEVATMSTTISFLQSTITTLQYNAASQSTTITALQSDVAQLTADVQAKDIIISNNAVVIADLTSDNHRLEQDIARLTNHIKDLERHKVCLRNSCFLIDEVNYISCVSLSLLLPSSIHW